MLEDFKSIIFAGGVVSGIEDWFVLKVWSVEFEEFPNPSSDIIL